MLNELLAAKCKYHWKENIKPALLLIMIGALIVVGMRIADIAWPRAAARVVICFANDIGKIDACKPFDVSGN